MPGATFDPFEVVVVPFPFTDKAASKRRPALVISTAGFNAGHGQLILAMITSSDRGAWQGDVRLESWRAAGLAVPCRVRIKLFTLDKTMIIRRLGALAADDRRAVCAALKDSLAIK